MPKILYGVERSPVIRAILITAKALDIHLEFQIVEPFKNEQKLESFLKMNPAHTIPTLDDDGFYVWESRVIMGYLVSMYGKDDRLYPKGAKERANVDTILHFDNGSLWNSITTYLHPIILNGEAPSPEKEENIKDKLTTLERILSERPYLAGDHLTIADICVVPTVSSLPLMGVSLENYPNINNLIAKVKTELPFFDEVDKKGREELIALVEEKMKNLKSS